MLRVIIGRAKTGKSEICSREFAAAAASGAENGMYYIVPEQFAVEAEHRILSLDVMKGKSLFEAEVLSFKRLIHRILSRLGGGSGKVLSRSGRAMLLISSLSTLSGDLEWFKDMQGKPSMVLALLKLIDELETYNSDRTALEQKLTSLADPENNSASPKYKDLLLIYREYSRRVREAYTSAGDACENACRKAEEYGFFKGARIWIDEFTGFTDPELNLIDCMLRSGAEVTVTLCTSREGEPVFKAIDRTLENLLKHASDSKTGYKVENAEELLTTETRPRRAKTLEALERRYTKYVSAAIPETELSASEVNNCIRMVKARDNYSELKAAAGYVRELHDEGFPYGSIVIAVRNINDYSACAGPVFSAAGIPFYVDDMHSVASDPVILTLLGLLDLVIFDMAREDAAALLKTGMIIDDRERVDELDNIMLARNLHGSGAFARFKDDGKTEFQKLYGICKETETAFRKAATVAEAVDGLRRVLVSLDLESQANRLADELRQSSAPEKSDELSRIWNIIVDLLEQIKTLLGDEPARGAADRNARATAAQLKAYIETGFAGLEIGFIPQDRDTVRMIGAGRSRPGNPRALLLLGGNEGVMPANITSGGIVRDSERDLMIDAGIGLADDSLLRAYKELYMVYSVLFAPSERLYVSYALKNADGDEAEPSAAVVKKLEKILPALKTEEYSAKAPAPNGTGIFALPAGNARFFIDKALAEELFRPEHDMYLSISQIESYNKCPLAYFLERKLNIAEREECELESNTLGSVVHEVLEKCGADLSKEVSGKPEAELEPYSKSLVDAHFDNAVKGNCKGMDQYYSPKDKLIIDRLKGFCEEVVLAIARQQYGITHSTSGTGQYSPIAFEYSFGTENDDLPAPEVKIGDDASDVVKLKGKIDRLDAFSDGTRYYINIIDYKSSKKSLNEKDLRNGVNIQLLVYLKATTGTKEAREVIAGLINDNNSVFMPEEPVSEGDIEPAACLYLVYDDAIKSESSESKQEPYSMTGILITGSVDAANTLNSKDKQNVICAGKNDRLDGETFDKYTEITEHAIRNTAQDMLDGKFGARPKSYTGKNGSERNCVFCPFSAVCGIEPAAAEKQN